MVPPVPPATVVVVADGGGTSPLRIANTASASGFFTSSTDCPSRVAGPSHGRVTKVSPPLPSASPKNTFTSALNDERSNESSTVSLGITLSARSGAISGSFKVWATAIFPNFFTNDCWRSMRSRSASGLASTHLPSFWYSRWRDRTYASDAAPSRG